MTQPGSLFRVVFIQTLNYFSNSDFSTNHVNKGNKQYDVNMIERGFWSPLSSFVQQQYNQSTQYETYLNLVKQHKK